MSNKTPFFLPATGNVLLAVSVFAVFSILVALNYENMASYSTHVAIKTVKLENNQSTPHLDMIRPGFENHTIPFKDIEWNNDNTLKVTFGGGKSFSDHFGDIPNFDYANTFSANQTFAWRCIEQPGYTHLGFYKYLGTDILHGDHVILLWHYEGKTRYPMHCNYPDLIMNSVDLVDYDYASILGTLSKHEPDIYKNLIMAGSSNLKHLSNAGR